MSGSSTYGLWTLVGKVISNALGPAITDDAIDRVNRVYTALLLILFSVFVSMKNYVGDPVQCWLQPYKEQREDYVNTVCWISNTYYLGIKEQVPKNILIREDAQIHYYQWVPLILLTQALLFEIPFHFWRSFHIKSGINIEALIKRIVKENFLIREKDQINKDISFLGEYVRSSLDFQRKWGEKSSIFKIGLTHGNYVFAIYMVTKLLYLCNVVGQTMGLNKFLDTRYFLYGFDLLKDFVGGDEWQDTGRFPRITLCDYEVRILGNLHRHTVQCVLTINLFNEKIYMFLWFWMFFVSLATFINACYWLYWMCWGGNAVTYVKMLWSFNDPDEIDEKKAAMKLQENKGNIASEIDKDFVNRHLGVDGTFLLRMVHHNASALVATRLLRAIVEAAPPSSKDSTIAARDTMYPNLSENGASPRAPEKAVSQDGSHGSGDDITMKDKPDENKTPDGDDRIKASAPEKAASEDGSHGNGDDITMTDKSDEARVMNF